MQLCVSNYLLSLIVPSDVCNWVALSTTIYIGRVPIYVSMYGYILLPWLIDQIFEKTSAKLVYLVMIVLYFVYFYYQMELVWGLLG